MPAPPNRLKARPLRLALWAVLASSVLCSPSAGVAQEREPSFDLSTRRSILDDSQLRGSRSELDETQDERRNSRRNTPAYTPYTGRDEALDDEELSERGRNENGVDNLPAFSTSAERAQEREQTALGREDADDLTTGTIADEPLDEPVVDPRTAAAPTTVLDDASFGRQASVDDPAIAIERLESRTEDDPFAATGIRTGRFILRPSIQTGLRVTDNAELTTEKTEAVYSETELRLDAISDFSRHQASIDGRLTYLKPLTDGIDDERPEIDIDAAALVEIGSLHRINLTAAYAQAEEGAEAPIGSIATLADTAEDPLRHDIAASVGFEKYDGRLRYALTGSADRSSFGDAELSDGTSVSQEDRNATLYALRGRLGYVVSPALVPFAEVEIGRRIYDNEIDAGGFERGADRRAVYAGVEFDREEKLNGEIALGYLQELPDDERIDGTEGLALRGLLEWSPHRGTRVGLQAETSVETAAGSVDAGALLKSATLTASRQVRSDLLLEAQANATRRDYTSLDGTDVILGAQLGFAYSFSRSLALIGEVSHERQRSDLPGRDYDANSAFLGVRLQR